MANLYILLLYLVVTGAIDSENIQIGDAITFIHPSKTRDNEFVTRRVVNKSIVDGILQFEIQGDVNDNPDYQPVDSSNVVGKVIFVMLYLGYLPGFVKQPIGFMILIVISGSLIIINELWYTSKLRKEELGKESEK